MRKSTVVWMVAAVSLILIGCLILGGVLIMLGWDFSKLSTVQLESNTYKLEERISDIEIVSDTAGIVFVPTNESVVTVTCQEEINAKHQVSVNNGVLSIQLANTKKWYEYIGIRFESPQITVHLPQGEWGSLLIRSSTGSIEIPNQFTFEEMEISLTTGYVKNHASVANLLKIKTSTGSIVMEELHAGSVEVSATTGKIALTDIQCDGALAVDVTTGKTLLKNVVCGVLTSAGNTGDIRLEKVLSGTGMQIVRTTGDICFDQCDAADLRIKTDTGDVTGTLLTEKVFLVETDTGRTDVPRTTGGGICEITTDTGDILLTYFN